MDWIETTAKSVEEAKEAALDELGVDEEDAEFEVLSEPKSGLFGRLREEARVRARVRPTAPRPKDDRRDRRRRTKPSSEVATASGDDTSTATATATVPGAGASSASPAADAGPVAATNGHGRPRRGGSERPSVDVDLGQQAGVAEEFLRGLIAEFGLTGEITTSVDEAEDVIEVAVQGDGLGLLIGPKGSTLLALQDLTRSAVQQKTGAGNGRLNIDVSGYRAKRTEALVRFAHKVAEQVKASGTNQALEPMSAIDRKVIHDALTDFDGVSTVSQGEDSARRVVVVPAQG